MCFLADLLALDRLSYESVCSDIQMIRLHMDSRGVSECKAFHWSIGSNNSDYADVLVTGEQRAPTRQMSGMEFARTNVQ